MEGMRKANLMNCECCGNKMEHLEVRAIPKMGKPGEFYFSHDSCLKEGLRPWKPKQVTMILEENELILF